MTGGAPLYLRSALSAAGEPEESSARRTSRRPASEVSRRALWWPPSKIAGRYLAPLLATARPPLLSAAQLQDYRPGPEGADRDDAYELALMLAEEDAAMGDYAPGAARARRGRGAHRRRAAGGMGAAPRRVAGCARVRTDSCLTARSDPIASTRHTCSWRASSLDEHRLRRLVDVGRSLVTVLDPEAVFERLLDGRARADRRPLRRDRRARRAPRAARALPHRRDRRGDAPRDRRPAARARRARRADQRPAPAAAGATSACTRSPTGSRSRIRR